MTWLFSALLAGHAYAEEEQPAQLVVSDAERASLLGSMHDFSSDIYGQLKPNKGNLFFSPYSITQALAMTYAGAADQTAIEMQTVLHFRMNMEYTHATMQDLLKGKDRSGAYTFHTANGLWVQKDYDILPQFSETADKNYNAKVSTLDFEKAPQDAAGTINSWIEEKTAGKIKELITPDAITSETRLILTNAVYFRADWQDAFLKNNTHQEEFFVNPGQNSTGWMMNRVCTNCRYGDTDAYQAVAMPYKGGEMEMVMFLPRDKSGLEAFEEKLNPQTLREALESLTMDNDVNITLRVS